ncbi:hypothetical protein VOLCADRAFT_103219 [Volvox carteri f. nagariensis]|uniref:Uncharacterized protein n=1 Tax=Volvox carteri f. nagariensis TaxID=3068 RepID=D8TK97_VOLCA|nr:uncharacterized protein VOLCADRAFT_103219 [Volvox carteri f. nagariensis]EFJ52020.1 hypothetical protein VOLCADRAFT_103219 [Volvox carteri f. nagariensis]|eukprot:XP_002946794.1 hypothetical protein VOLCADRAFT_103219 [Volvox carteri f. nagariensis]
MEQDFPGSIELRCALGESYEQQSQNVIPLSFELGGVRSAGDVVSLTMPYTDGGEVQVAPPFFDVTGTALRTSFLRKFSTHEDVNAAVKRFRGSLPCGVLSWGLRRWMLRLTTVLVQQREQPPGTTNRRSGGRTGCGTGCVESNTGGGAEEAWVSGENDAIQDEDTTKYDAFKEWVGKVPRAAKGAAGKNRRGGGDDDDLGARSGRKVGNKRQKGNKGAGRGRGASKGTARAPRNIHP